MEANFQLSVSPLKARGENGAIVVFMAVAIPLIILFVAFAIDIALLTVSQQRADGIAKLLALAAIEEFNDASLVAAPQQGELAPTRRNVLDAVLTQTAKHLARNPVPFSASRGLTYESTAASGARLEPGRFFQTGVTECDGFGACANNILPPAYQPAGTATMRNPCPTASETPPCFMPAPNINDAAFPITAFRVSANLYSSATLGFLRFFYGAESFPMRVKAVASVIPMQVMILIESSSALVAQNHSIRGEVAEITSRQLGRGRYAYNLPVTQENNEPGNINNPIYESLIELPITNPAIATKPFTGCIGNYRLAPSSNGSDVVVEHGYEAWFFMRHSIGVVPSPPPPPAVNGWPCVGATLGSNGVPVGGLPRVLEGSSETRAGSANLISNVHYYDDYEYFAPISKRDQLSDDAIGLQSLYSDFLNPDDCATDGIQTCLTPNQEWLVDMYRRDDGGPRPMNDILRGAQAAVQYLKDRSLSGDKVGLIFFDSKKNLGWTRIVSPTNDFNSLLRLLDGTIQGDKLRAHLGILPTSAGADITKAIDAALSLLSKSHRDAQQPTKDNIVVVSTGLQACAYCGTDRTVPTGQASEPWYSPAFWDFNHNGTLGDSIDIGGGRLINEPSIEDRLVAIIQVILPLADNGCVGISTNTDCPVQLPSGTGLRGVSQSVIDGLISVVSNNGDCSFNYGSCSPGWATFSPATTNFIAEIRAKSSPSSPAISALVMSEQGDDTSKTVAHEIRYRHSSGTRCATAKESQKLGKKVTLYGCETPLTRAAIINGETGVSDLLLCLNNPLDSVENSALMADVSQGYGVAGIPSQRYAYTQPISFLAQVAGITGGEYSPLYLQTNGGTLCDGIGCCPSETNGTMQTRERQGRSVEQQTADFFTRVVRDNQPFSIGIAK